MTADTLPPLPEPEPEPADYRLTRPLNKRERAVLGPPHPGDFGIPKEYWQAARYFAEFVIQQRAAAIRATSQENERG
jgi:hypothetical protein